MSAIILDAATLVSRTLWQMVVGDPCGYYARALFRQTRSRRMEEATEQENVPVNSAVAFAVWLTIYEPLMVRKSEQVGIHRLWRGHCKANGYGQIRRGGKTQAVHRYLWSIWHHQRIPPGMDVDHRCKIRNCFAPWCLQLRPHRVNRAPHRRALHTHCRRGHPVTPENSTGHQRPECKPCRRSRDRIYRQAKKQAAKWAHI